MFIFAIFFECTKRNKVIYRLNLCNALVSKSFNFVIITVICHQHFIKLIHDNM